jgi:hypothetical protein
MKILIGTIEKSNMIELYRKSLQSIKHDVITIVVPHIFFNSNIYTHDLLTPKFLFKLSSNRYFNIIKWNFGKLLISFKKIIFFIFYRNKIDAMIVIGDGFFNDKIEDFKYLRKKGRGIIQIFFGGDSRCWDAFNQQYGIDISTVEKNPIDNVNFNSILTRLRKAELFANAIYSLPDQAGLAIRPYYRLYLPFEIDEYKFTIHDRDIPVIVHIESKQPYKGEEFIYNAIDNLKNQGIQFEFKVYQNLSHEEVISVLENADILVDEIILFGIGVLSNEAIACGCAVAAKVDKKHIISDYVCNIDIGNIEEPLREFILNKSLRNNNLKKSYEILKNNNNPKNIARDIEQKIKNDFLVEENKLIEPNFFVNNYTLPEGHVVSEYNKKLTRQVFQKYCSNLDLQQSLIDRKLMS